MAHELIRPIDADTAAAIEETAKAAGKAIDAVSGAGRYFAEVMGDVPHHLVGFIGDWLAHQRVRRFARLNQRTEEILRARGVENREDVSPSVALPLIAAAIDEDREVLTELWAKLLAAALDPKRAGQVRPALIDILRKMDPLDAACLLQLADPAVRQTPANAGPDLVSRLRATVGGDVTDVTYSLVRLHEMGLTNQSPLDSHIVTIGLKGELLLRAVAD